MAWADLTDEERQIIGSWLGASRDAAGKIAEALDMLTALSIRYDSGVGTILATLDTHDVIKDGQAQYGKNEMDKNDSLLIHTYFASLIAWYNDDIGKARMFEGASGRSVIGGNYIVPEVVPEPEEPPA